MIVAFTGHRPARLGGYGTSNPMRTLIKNEMRRILKEISPKQVISGMALGVDQWAAEVCIELSIPFVAAVPFKGQELYWPQESRERYFELLALAQRIEYVNPGGYASWKLQVRNEWLVDNSDILIAVFDGGPGGTKNCFEYASSYDKKIIRINPQDLIDKSSKY